MMKHRKNHLLAGLAFVGASVIGLGIGEIIGEADTNQGNNPISKVATSGFDKKQVLEVANKPFFYNGIQIRSDKLRDSYGYNINDIRNTFKQAKNDGFTVINTQILWSDIQKDQVLNPTDVAYVKNGADATKNFDEKSTTFNLQNSDLSKSMVYLKYDLSKLAAGQAGHADGVKLRIYAKGTGNDSLNIYGLDKDDNWNKDISWNKSPLKDLGDQKPITVSPKYDPIKGENYYDFDVTDFVNRQNAGQVTLALQSQAGTGFDIGGGAKIGNMSHLDQPLNEIPQLSVSSKNNYDYSYLDQIIKAARDADIKLEVLWFGSDTTKLVTEHRIPFYVQHDYKPALNKDGSIQSFSRAEANSGMGQYHFAMDKNDPGLQQQEGTVVANLFKHIAENNQQNGSTDTVIGAQMPNEPSIAMSYAQPSVDARKTHANMTESEFKTWTLWNYTNNLDAQVKNSPYPVWTRVNNAAGDGGDALVAYNENQRKTKTTNLDFVGLDSYQTNTQGMFDYGHKGTYAQGDNFPAIMEDGMGANSWSWANGNYSPLDAGLRTITTLAGGATRNYYDFKSGDGFDLYDSENADGSFKPHEYNGGAAINSVRDVNHFLNKIGHDLATKQADGAGGKQLLFFNPVPAPGYDFHQNKQLGKTDVTYKTDTNKSMGVAIQRDADDIVLGSTLDSNATFTLKNFGKPTAITFGQYESPQSDKWETTSGKVDYQTNKDGSITVTVPKYAVVNVSKAAQAGGDTGGSTGSGTTTGTSSSSSSSSTAGSSSSSSSSSSSTGTTDTNQPSTGSTTGDSGLASTSVKKVKPFKVMAKKAIYRYSKVNFSTKNRIKYYPQKSRTKAPVFTVVGTAKSSSGVDRYQLKGGSYITANSAYVTKLYLQTNHKRLKMINPKGAWEHSNTKFTSKNAIKKVKKNTILKARKLVKRGSTTRYQLTNGHYITGSKQFVQVIK
ncbi:DUF5776 domain-containing protein [Lentilactobacillus diolivorans]|uniref:DUF5776 domain-containing protein n=1 Tax=Lentilactobacillus diolivorans TaxID=179838 RepID=UPI0024692982|nr:DUF5776 domain-containing protein [Lentilactobacillus diolivorans]MDH5105277.1 DUF5776 domain-containing protein [Lentilactobacillus diolivorans]